MLKKRFLKWIGYGSSVVLLVGVAAPRMIDIPVHWRPWLFLALILWFFLFSTGFFNR